MSDIKELSHEAVNEAYTLISAYIREERVAATYNVEHLKVIQKFLADTLSNPENFKPVEVESV